MTKLFLNVWLLFILSIFLPLSDLQAKENAPIIIAGTKVDRDEIKKIKIPLPSLFSSAEMFMPVYVINGKKAGPILFISAAIHGDEIIGTEIIKTLMQKDILKTINGTLIMVPIVNPYAYNSNSRYLPDRRDLNRYFPGAEDKSLTEQVANIFVKEILSKSNYGIDIHSAPVNKSNFPNIRYNENDEESLRLARAFKTPVMLKSKPEKGTLRDIASNYNSTVILFEGGEGLRYDDTVINTCIDGILNVMHELQMIKLNISNVTNNTIRATSSHWVRASESGSLRSFKKLGEFIKAGDILGEISDHFLRNKAVIKATKSGVLIGTTTLPLVYKGDALFHIAIPNN
jgi:predicted deacylase